METRTLLQIHRAEILDPAARHGARNVRVFGSVARGDARPEQALESVIRHCVGR